VNRPSVAIILTVLAMVGMIAVQWFVTSPHVITYGEFRLTTLAGVPALTAVLCARWVDDGRRDW
jgi:hypothetical protein